MEYPTIRDRLRRRKRWALIVLAGAWLLMFPTWWLEDKPSSALLVPEIFAFAGFFGSFIFLAFFIRCPRCRGNLGTLNAGFSKAIPFYTVINYCPYCSVSLDSRLEP